MDFPQLGLSQSPPPKSAARRNLNCWSNLPLDLTKLVFDRLGFADFERAKSVCSSWLSGSRQSQPNNQIPWMISFPRDQNHCLLFNPEERKLYKTRDFGDDFAKSFCVTTHGSWLLMLDPIYGDYCESESKEENPCQYNLYILHLLTGKRINLPTLELECLSTPAVFWIDEKTKDYIVIKMFDEETTVSLKKGDNSWKQIPHLSGIQDSSNMLYKDHKLYCLSDYKLQVFDFSGEIPLLVFEIRVDGCIKKVVGRPDRYFRCVPYQVATPCSKKNVVVTLSGDILIVIIYGSDFEETWDFSIHKLKGNNMWEEIDSLGDDEAILLDLGITVLTKDIHGVLGNSIYFTIPDFEDPYDENDILVFNLNTNKVEKPHQFVSSSLPFYSCWFLPSFKP